MFVVPDAGILSQYRRILFSGGGDNELIRRISVKGLRERRRSVAEYGGQRHEPEFGHVQCDTKPFFRIAGDPDPFLLQELAKLPGRNHGEEELVIVIGIVQNGTDPWGELLGVHVPPDPDMGI